MKGKENLASSYPTLKKTHQPNPAGKTHICVVSCASLLLSVGSCCVGRDCAVLWFSSSTWLSLKFCLYKIAGFVLVIMPVFWGLLVGLHLGNKYCDYGLWFGRSCSNAWWCINSWEYTEARRIQVGQKDIILIFLNLLVFGFATTIFFIVLAFGMPYYE